MEDKDSNSQNSNPNNSPVADQQYQPQSQNIETNMSLGQNQATNTVTNTQPEFSAVVQSQITETIPTQTVAYSPIVSQPIPDAKSNNSPGLIVLQWLTYAFWGWTAIAILWMVTTVSVYNIIGYDVSSMVPYSMAAILVLLPISIICDLFYIKKEPTKKTGAASVVMIIHAVIFALCGVGSLVVLVLNLVSMLINGISPSIQTMLICAGVMFVVYAALFIRTIIPGKIFFVRRFMMIFMTIISITLLALSITGPIANISLTKNDKLITDNISKLSTGISSYVSKNNQLPNSLNEVSNLEDSTKKLITDNLVTYKKESPVTPDSDSDSNYSDYSDSVTYRYQLCVNYKKADSTNSMYSSSFSSSVNDDYSSYPSTYGHPAGEVCYKISTN